MGRGAFIVLEGCDRAGKSTQVKMLVDALQKISIPVNFRSFPDRSTAIGQVIANYLTCKFDATPEVIHLLFSANRWECSTNIQKSLESGITLIVDRYAASGAAYGSANTGRDLSWCKAPDQGLPAPDLVVYLDVNPEVQNKRAQWGDERFEREDFQRKVDGNFKKLFDDSWVAVNANASKEQIHSKILAEALKCVKFCKDEAIRKLYL